jgi:hypothetical protein
MWAKRVARATSNRYSTFYHTLWRISWLVFAQASLIRVLSSCSVVGSGGQTLSFTKLHKKRSIGVRSGDLGHRQQNACTTHELVVELGALPVLSSKLLLHCNNRFRFRKRKHREYLLRAGRNFTVLTNVALPCRQNAQLAPIKRQIELV